MKEIASDHVTLLTGPNSTDFVDRYVCAFVYNT